MDEEEQRPMNHNRRSLVIRHLPDPYFKKHFRMNKVVFERLVHVVAHERRAMGKLVRARTPVPESTLIGLWILFNGDTFRSSGLQFDMNMGTAHYHYSLLLDVLCRIGSRYIKWPNPRQRQQTSIYYERKFGFPGIVGAIDGTLVPITAPAEQKQRYIDRNNNYSINVMMVSNHRRLIIDTYIGEPGNVHDNRVLRSPLAKCLFGRDDLAPDEHLIGDGGYMLTSKLLIPYVDDGHLTPEHTYYNHVLSQCRSTVERLNALWKLRMQRLGKVYTKSVATLNKHLASSAVVYNFILLEGEEADGMVIEGDVPNVDVLQAMLAAQPGGREKRRVIRGLLNYDSDEE